MRLLTPGAIGLPGGEAPEPGLAPTSDDFLSRVNFTINNFKELVKVAAEFRLAQGGGIMPNQPHEPKMPASPSKVPALADYVQMAINNGYGDVPIGKLIEQLNPFTLTQVMEFVKNARLNR